MRKNMRARLNTHGYATCERILRFEAAGWHEDPGRLEYSTHQVWRTSSVKYVLERLAREGPRVPTPGSAPQVQQHDPCATREGQERWMREQALAGGNGSRRGKYRRR